VCGAFMVALVDDLPKAMLAAFLVALVVLELLALVAPHTRSGGLARWLVTGHPRHWLAVAAGALVFAAIAEDVLEGEQHEWVLRLDQWVRMALLEHRRVEGLRATAVTLSWMTGEGLAVFIVAVTAILLLARRIRDAAILCGATLGAWALSGVLKVVFSVPRPRAEPPWSITSSFGFPSGHAFVTLVVCGLVAWLLGRGSRPTTRAALYGGTLVVGALSGSARIVLDAHWASDVIAGLALGSLCLSLLMLTVCASRSRPARSLASIDAPSSFSGSAVGP